MLTTCFVRSCPQLEVAWANETWDAFCNKVRFCHGAGRNVLGVSMWWNGQKGNASYSAGDVWRMCDKARTKDWKSETRKSSGDVAYVPLRWFLDCPRAQKRITNSLGRIEAKLAITLARIAGEPPMSVQERRQWTSDLMAGKFKTFKCRVMMYQKLRAEDSSELLKRR